MVKNGKMGRIIAISKYYADGKIKLPKRVAKKLKLLPGDDLIWEEEGGIVTLKKS